MKKYYFLFAMQFLLGAAFSQTPYTVTGYGGLSMAKRGAFAIDNIGNKWIGFTTGTSSSQVLMRFDGTNWISFQHDFPTNKVYALAVDTGKTLWVGTNYGLFKFYDTTLVGTYMGGPILSLACGGGNLYEGTTNGLVIRNNSGTTSFSHSSSSLTSDTILSVTYEGPNAIWIGNGKGLDKFDGVGSFSFNNVQPSQNDSVMCIYIDGSNNKWLGTNHHGVIKYDNSTFYTMPQLYGTPLGVSWPVKAYSIDKGPSGGIFFSGHARANYPGLSAYNLPCSIELVGNQVKTYAWIATSSQSTAYYYPIIKYDAVHGKVFYVNVDASVNPFLYSFDASQYMWPSIIQNNSDYLDINNVQALITSSADMGWDLQGTKYFVPKGSNSSPLKAASLWMGGYHNGNLRVGAMTYRQNGADFWPGPLDPLTDSTDVATSAAYDKVWKVNRYDIANFIYNWNAGNVQNGTFFPPQSILTWPGNNTYQYALAPFVDVNGNGYYDPINDGDYPDIKGDQMIWWVFNDRLYKHSETGGNTMGVQVYASAYAYTCPTIADSNRVLNNTTFYNYKVMNFSQDRLDSFYLGSWVDADLGNYQDDYIQCDVANNYGYIMNGDAYDEDASGITGYHSNLPYFSCNILSGPPADLYDGRDNDNDGVIDNPNERCMMNTFTYYTNTGDQYTGNPRTNTPTDYYNFMNAKWRNGVPITYGGNGVNPASTEYCRHIYPGTSDPYGVSIGGTSTFPHSPAGNYGTCGWTQQQANVMKSDMRFLIGVGPFTAQPGGTYELDYALIFSQDSTIADTGCVHPLAQQDNIRVKRWFDNNSFPSCLSLAGVGVKESKSDDISVSLYPNPASDVLYVELKEVHSKATVEVLDLLGNVVKGATYLAPSKYMSIPVSEFASGLYVLRVTTPSGKVSKKFIKN